MRTVDEGTGMSSARPDTRGNSALPPLERQSFRDAMAKLAAAVNIITSIGENGRCGFTASAVCSVTDSPPTLLVCINKNSQSHPVITSSQVLCVNTVAGPHEDLSLVFAGGVKDMGERFVVGEWTTLVTGAPVLREATVAFDCRVTQVAEVGTHDVVFCEVLAIHEGGSTDGLVYFGRKFHRLG
jgi:flavin reductase